MVTTLTLFCLAQNSGLFNLVLNLERAQGAAAEPLSVLYSSALKSGATNSSAIEGDNKLAIGTSETSLSDVRASEAGSFEFKRCELSEKSMRLCLEDTSVVALLVLLFLLPLSPSFARVLSWVPKKDSFVRYRRIHLTFCRFQE